MTQILSPKRLCRRLWPATLGLAVAFTAPAAKAQTAAQRQLVQVPATIDKWPAKNKRFALVVGVDDYQDTQISRLVGAANDAKAIADALVRYAGFPRDQVVLLASDQPIERKPTRGNILRRLSNLRGLIPTDGLLLVSFSGHGLDRGGRGFLCPEDAQISGDMVLLEATAVPVDTVRDWIRQTGVQQAVIILDACRNNPSGRGETENRLTDSYARQFNFDVRNREVSAFATLYATGVGDVAYEYKEKKHGYFTWALVEGLKGAAANPKGEVTLEGLKNYLEEVVPKQVALDLGQGKNQRPFAIIEGYKADGLVISVAAPAPLTQLPPSFAPDCSQEASLRSIESRKETSYRITNKTTETLTVYWLDYGGLRKKWFDLRSGASVLQQVTYLTHPWLVADQTGRCRRIFYAPADIVIE